MMNDTPTTRPIWELSRDGEILEAVVLAHFRHNRDPEYTLSYHELNAKVSGDVVHDTNLSQKLTKAIKRVEKDLKIKLERDPNRYGVVLIPPEGYVAVSSRDLAIYHRGAKRFAKENLRLASLDGVSQEDRQKLLDRASVAQCVAAFTRKDAVRKVEDLTAANNEQRRRTIDDTIAALRGSRKTES